jgi:hypothetical protein
VVSEIAFLALSWRPVEVIQVTPLISFYSFSLQGMSFPTAHVEESWQMAEFYNNKVYAFSITSFLQYCSAIPAYLYLLLQLDYRIMRNRLECFGFLFFWKGP